MPRFRKKRKRRRRRHRKRRKHGKNSLTNITYSGPAFIAQSFSTKHTYSTFDSISGSTESLDTLQFSINNPFNSRPGVTGNERPMGYDQMSALYSKNMVSAAKIHLTIHCGDGTSPYLAILLPFPDSQTFTNSNPEHILQQPYSKSTVISEYLGGGSTKKLSSYVRLSSLIGKNVYDSTYSAVSGVGLSSDKEARWNLAIYRMEGAGTAFQYSIMIKIVYYIRWWDMQELDISSDIEAD